MSFFVSRQRYWPDSELFVEIASGGRDMANPDMLVPFFSLIGEGEEFADPRKAVEAALKIRDAWKKITDEEISVGHGCTGGMTMPFSPSTDEELTAWAEDIYFGLPKCQYCGELISKEYSNPLSFDEVFCSENCAEKDYEFQLNESEADDH